MMPFKTAASKRKLCSTEYFVESQIEDFLDWEEQHSAEVESLREENIAIRKNLVSMTQVMSLRRQIDAWANDASAEAFIDAMSDVQATIKDVGEDWD